MVDDAVQERDTDKRRAMYEEMQKIHRDTSAFVTMFQEIGLTARRNNVANLYTGGTTDQVTYWYVTK